MSTQILAGFKVQGQTAGSVAIGTVTVNFNSDGTWDFTDSATPANTIVYHGDSAEINALLKILFTGAGGLTAGLNQLFGYPGS
jgi:hypothetical protein